MNALAKMLAVLPTRQFTTLIVAISITSVVLVAAIMIGKYAFSFASGGTKLDLSPSALAG